jgi:hypothetical protein
VSTSSTTSAKSIGYFFGGDASGLAAGLETGLAAGLAAGVAVVAAGDGVGNVAAGRSLTTDEGPLTPGSENRSARNIKSAAATIVAFSSGF